MSAPLVKLASTTTVPKVIPATMRLRMGKLCLSALRLKGNWVINAPCAAMRPNNSPFSSGKTRLIPVPSTAMVRPFAHHGDPGVSQLVGDLARHFDPVLRRHARTDHGHRVLVPRRQAAQDI